MPLLHDSRVHAHIHTEITHQLPGTYIHHQAEEPEEGVTVLTAVEEIESAAIDLDAGVPDFLAALATPVASQAPAPPGFHRVDTQVGAHTIRLCMCAPSDIH